VHRNPLHDIAYEVNDEIGGFWHTALWQAKNNKNTTQNVVN